MPKYPVLKKVKADDCLYQNEKGESLYLDKTGESRYLDPGFRKPVEYVHTYQYPDGTLYPTYDDLILRDCSGNFDNYDVISIDDSQDGVTQRCPIVTCRLMF